MPALRLHQEKQWYQVRHACSEDDKTQFIFNKLNDNQNNQIHKTMKIRISTCQRHLGIKNNMSKVKIQRT